MRRLEILYPVSLSPGIEPNDMCAPRERTNVRHGTREGVRRSRLVSSRLIHDGTPLRRELFISSSVWIRSEEKTEAFMEKRKRWLKTTKQKQKKKPRRKAMVGQAAAALGLSGGILRFTASKAGHLAFRRTLTVSQATKYA